MAVLHRSRVASLLVMVGLVGALSACGGSDAAQSEPGLSCVNNALQGGGQYHNEVSVRVDVSNSTTHKARYEVRVDLTASSDPPGSAPSMHVMITGPVASSASAVLARKVLTADRVRGCRVAWTVRLGQS